ncbi:uncharacterized protein LOC129247628 isoform X2 [Anastrepha obliqua]|uniref:uncharacterized protein LOC129247628 isoform X2 n=1 Tax=Anastrepha obliqua TaxID=95512 RepID=UPI0024091BCA|nr:uncharacterized protein LOC129247628 isoform X2 [Anastrepha obliqua]
MLAEFQELGITSRKGSLPNIHELVSMNVVKTCEKLRLAITQTRNDLQHTLDVTRRRQTEDLSFRSISGLCYTTLRVHELQVNDLLNKSEALVAQSHGWSTLQARKRSQPSSCSTSYRSKRKRQQTVKHSLTDVSLRNYKQLLDETESFVEWSKAEEVMEKDSYNRTSCIHIRDITIDEVDIPSGRSDEDEGFGNATADELTTILQLLSDKPIEPVMKSLKRQPMDISGVCEKKCRPSHGTEDDMTRGGHEHPENEIAVEKGVDNHFINEIEVSPNNNNISSDVAHSNNDMAIQDNISDRMKSTEKILPKATNTSYICNQGSAATNNAKFKMKKVIIDECTELSQKEMHTQLRAQINIKAKLIKTRAIIEWSAKRNLSSGKRYDRFIPSASNLLCKLHRSSRSCITMRRFKLKNKVSRSRLETSTVRSTYRNLLRAILNCEITDDLATQIYRNWNKCGKYNLKNTRSRQKLQTPVPENIPCLQEENDCNQMSLAPNYASESAVCNNNNNLERTIDVCTPSNDQDEWSAFDVMVKLLNLWRSKKVPGDEIPVEYLLQHATLARKKAAKAFGSLLKLAASRFIVLLPKQNSLQLQSIQLGAASAKLIHKNEVNGMSLRRSNNGYRIHAS